MNNFIFENGTKAFFGKGCVKEYLACLSGHYGKNIIEFPGIMANPTYGKVMEGAKLAREAKIDLILGVGGGSVMDCCKAVSMAAVYDGDIWTEFFARPGIMEFEPLPLGVVVTVTGTGSEMNGSACRIFCHWEK